MSFRKIRILWGFVHGTYLENERDEPFCGFHVGLVFHKLFFQKALFEQHLCYQIDGEDKPCGDAQKGKAVNDERPDDEQYSQIHGVSDESVRPSCYEHHPLLHERRNIDVADTHDGESPDPDCHSANLGKKKQKMVCHRGA